MLDRFNHIDSERHSTRSERRAKAEAVPPAPADLQPAAAAPKRRWALWLCLLLCLVGSSAASYVVFKYIVVPSVPLELVGTWQVTHGPMQGATLEFRDNGTAVAVKHEGGKRLTTHSAVEVKGKRIFLTTRDASGEETVVQRIVKLTDDELVIRDEDQLTYSMRRVRN
jgi:uncharacterized protein (TIGR03066 family)